MADNKKKALPFLQSRFNQFLILLALLSFLFFVWARAYILTPTSIRKENLDQLYTAKTAKEFAVILRAPPGDYRIGEYEFQFIYMDRPHPTPANCVCQQWITDDLIVEGWFDAEGTKAAFDFAYPIDSTRRKPSVWQRLQRIFSKVFTRN